ncbi:MAG: AAA family ATPase [Oscillospiraceae bacterium]|nr:AAA family ATPase [Oscillospiraceae bacterium]
MKHITITGSLGSGKTVVSKLLNEYLGFEIESIGSLQRKMAQKYGMSTFDFNKYMETHPEFDHELDSFVKEQGQSEIPKIFDSRLAWHFIPESLKVYLYVTDEIAARRVYNDKYRINENYSSTDVALSNIIQRRKSEVLRFKTQYEIDLENLNNYDLIIDTSFVTPDEIASKIIFAYKNAQSKKEFWLSPYTLMPTQSIRNHSREKLILLNGLFDHIDKYAKKPIEVLINNNNFYIYNGHKRTLIAITKQFALLPCTLLNSSSNDKLMFNQTVNDYIDENTNEEIFIDWNEFVNYLKNNSL